MNVRRILLSVILLGALAPGASIAQLDTRMLYLRLPDGGQYMDIFPDGRANMGSGTSPTSFCGSTGPGFFDFDSLHRRFKAASYSKWRNRIDVEVNFMLGGGQVSYLENRAEVLEMFRKARKWIVRSSLQAPCPEIPES